MNYRDVVKESEYLDIILSLLSKPYNINSLTKLIIMSFCIKHENKASKYQNRRNDIIDCFFSNIQMNLLINYKDIEVIINAVKKLEKNNYIRIEEDRIINIKIDEHKTLNTFIEKCLEKTVDPIKEVNKLDAIAVVEEVVRNV